MERCKPLKVFVVTAVLGATLVVGAVSQVGQVRAVPPADNPFDASRAIRYTADGTVIGSVVRSLVNKDDSVTTYPSGFPTNFFGTKYDNICISTNGGVYLTNSPVKVTTSADPIDNGDCIDYTYDNSVSYMAIFSEAPFISVLAADHNPSSKVYTTPTQQIFDTTVTAVTGGDTTITSGVPHGLGVGNIVEMYASPTGASVTCTKDVTAVASATEFTINSACSSTPVRFGRPRQYGSITAITVSAGLVTVTMSAHKLATGNLITFAGLNIPQLDDQHFEVTRLSATEISFPAPAGIDPSLSGLAPLGTSNSHKFKWFESDGYGAVGQIYFGVTTVESRPAMVVTWYRVPMYRDANPRVRYSTIQLVLVQKPTGDSTVGYDFDVEFNYGSMTDDENGYTVNSEGDWGCGSRSTAAGSNCRWGIGWANYRQVGGVESYSVANGLVTLTTTNPHGLKPGDLVEFDTVDGSAAFEDDYGRVVAGTSGTTLITEAPWEIYSDVALTVVPTPSSALLKVSDDFEMYANTWVGNLVDQSTVSATRMIVNNMNAPTVPGRYTFAMVGGVTQGFEAPAMGRPSSPRNVSATLSDTAMTVSWTEPLSNGGSTITGYTVRVFPGGASCTVSGSARSCIIAGLDPETAYSVEVVATNENGNSNPALALGAQAPAPLPQDLSNLPVVTPPPSTVAPSTTIPAPVPEQGGVLPALAPGASQVLVDGVPEVVEVVVVDSTVLVLRGGGFQLTLSGECSYGCTIRTNAEGRQILEMEENGTAKVAGDGFMPGSTVYVWQFSEPKFLGELTVLADGTFAGGVSLAGVENGSHTLQVNGTSFDGAARTANLGVLVSPAGAPTVFPDSLPAAGSDAGWLVWVMLLTSVGGALVWANRRRTIAAQR